MNSQEDDEAAEIELTYSILDNINQARPAFGRPAVCIIQVERIDMNLFYSVQVSISLQCSI